MLSEWLKLVLAARRKKPDGSITEIVIFIVIAAVYALSGILKMRSKDKDASKFSKRDIPEHPIRTKPRYKPLADAPPSPAATRGKAQKALPYAKRVARKPAPRQMRQQQRYPQQQPQRPVRPPQRTVETKPEEVIKKILEPFFEPQKPKQRPQRQARPTRRRRPAVRRPETEQAAAEKARRQKAKAAAKPAKKKAPSAPAKPVTAPAAFASLEHLSQPDNLKMAIVYAEILGQPVGLRDI